MPNEYKINCDVCQDLIPLVNDHVASEASEKLVFEHTKTCETCKALFDEKQMPQDIVLDDTKTIKAMKQYFFKIGLTVLLVGAILGVGMSNTQAQFYNLVLMPLLGIISVFLFEKKFWLSMVGIVVVSYFGHIILYIVETRSIKWDYIFYLPLTMTMVYFILTAVGVIIGALLKFAFKKEKSL